MVVQQETAFDYVVILRESVQYGSDIAQKLIEQSRCECFHIVPILELRGYNLEFYNVLVLRFPSKGDMIGACSKTSIAQHVLGFGTAKQYGLNFS